MSFRPYHTLIAGLMVLGVAPVAHAQASAPTKPVIVRPTVTAPVVRAARPISRTEFSRNLDANYTKLDTNNDGSITQSEIEAAQTRAEQAVNAMLLKRRAEGFARLDTNKDGQLSLAEFNTGSPLPRRPRANPADALAKLDLNKDKKVSLTEFRALPLTNFDKADLNRDGTISIDEQKKALPAAK